MKVTEEQALVRLRQNVATTLTCLQCDPDQLKRRELGGWLDEFTPTLSRDRAKEIALLLRSRSESWTRAARPGSLPRVAKGLHDAADAFLALL